MNTSESTKVSETPMDSTNKRDFLQRYTLEKVAHEKKTKYIEHQKKAFVRQHSKDENEVKQILQRLQIEQHILDGDAEEAEHGYTQDDDEEDKSDVAEDVFVNPYPVTIRPKFAALSNKGGKSGKDITGGRMGRRKSLEYEDLDKISLKGTTQNRPPSSTFRQTPTRKISTGSEPPDDLDVWVGNPEYISSVRRPRKSTSEVNHQKMIKRTSSDVWPRPKSSTDLPQSLSISKHTCPSDSSLDHCNKDETNSLSQKHSRKGSLKERKTSVNEQPIYETEGPCKRKGSFSKRGRSISDPPDISWEKSTGGYPTASLRKHGTVDTLQKKNSLPSVKSGNDNEKNSLEKPNPRARHRSLTERSERTMKDVVKPRSRHGSLKVKRTDTTNQDRKFDSLNEHLVSNSKITCFVEGDPIAKVVTFDNEH